MTVVITAISTTTSTTPATIPVAALAIATVVVLRRVVLEFLVLFPDVGEQIFAELLGSLNVVRVRTTLWND